ncbi:ATP-dependent DNA helicase PIF1-like protein [Tanacetum coccineum]
MRVNEYTSNGDIDTRKQTYNQLVLAVGDGKVPARIKDGEDKPTWIEITETFLIPSSESLIQQIVEETYPNFIQRQKDDAYLRERAILIPRNDDADAINAYMFDKLAVKVTICLEKAAIPGKAMLRNGNQQKPGTITQLCWALSS